MAAELVTNGREDLTQILIKPKNALVRQYEKMFALEGSELEFTPDSLECIAERAMKRETGVRALRSIIEESMLELLYELPHQEPAKYLITPEYLRGEAPVKKTDIPGPRVDPEGRNEPDDAEETGEGSRRQREAG